MTADRLLLGLFLGVAGCTSSPATDQSLGADFVVVTVTQASFSRPADAAPALIVHAAIRNPSSSAVTFLPDCGGDFGIERWSNGQWVPWGLLAACRSADLVTIGPHESRSASRSFTIEPGTFRLVVHEGIHETDRVAYSASFEAR
jgi:hypothetical protein